MTDYLSGEIVFAEPMPRADVATRTTPAHEKIAAEWLLSFDSENTIASYRRDLLAYFAWCMEFGFDPLAITPREADGYRRWLDERQKQATRARKLAAVSSFYKFGMQRYPERVAANPFLSVRRPKVSPRSETVGLTMEQALRLFDVAEQQGPWEHCMIQVLLSTGMRVSELVNARTWHIRPEGGHTTIEITRKGGKTDRIPLPPEAVQAIKAYVRNSGPILLGRNGGEVTRQEIARQVDRLARLAELPKLTPHCLRHTAATLAIAAGQPIERVQEMLGHESITTTMRYYHAADSVEKSAVHGLAAAYRRARVTT